MPRIYEQMYEQYRYRNKKSREAFIQLTMQWGATVHPIIYTYIYIYIYIKKNQFLCNRIPQSTKGLSQFHLSAKFQAALKMVSARKN